METFIVAKVSITFFHHLSRFNAVAAPPETAIFMP